MNYFILRILSFSVGIGALLSLIRWKHIHPKDYFFIAYLWAGTFNEIISTITIKLYRTNAIPSNIYELVASILLVCQFNNWQLFGSNKQICKWIIGGLSIFWLWENFVHGSIFQFGPYYRISFSFMIVLMAIHMINLLILQQEIAISKNHVFLICFSFVLFFTTKILVEIFYLYGLNGSKDFKKFIYDIISYINLLTNILYAIAILWIPKKRTFTWQ
ncbi:MAG: hypothetical protein WCP74_09325 [Sphingobacteriia bacterium]|jgi:hypothetical protein